MLAVRLLIALTLATCLAAPVAGQERRETVVLKSGRKTTGEILELKADSLVVARKVARGSVREEIRFDRIQPTNLYAILVSILRPLDRAAHRRIAGVAMQAELFPTARRHLLKSVRDGESPPEDVARQIRDCIDRDVAKLFARSDAELAKERFKAARAPMLLAMRRYPKHERVKTAPAQLERIKRRFEAARRRDAAVMRSRREKADWERAEKTLEDLEGRLVVARDQETRSLRSSRNQRRARGYAERGLRELTKMEGRLLKVRQSAKIPGGLRGRLARIEDELIAMHIRIRLHVASLYTIRGSYVNAMAWVNEALAYDPTDASALAARGRIEQAAAAAAARSGGIIRIR